MTAISNISAARIVVGQPDGGQLAVISDLETQQVVKAVGVQAGWTRFAVYDGGVERVVALINDGADPDLLMIDISESHDPLAEMEAVAEICRADTKVIVLGRLNDIHLYRGLLAMGVSDYLVKPVSQAHLMDAVRKVTSSAVEPVSRTKSARQIALIGSRGGVGVTTLAVSLAWTMSRRRNVALIDLDLQFGNVPISLDLAAGRGLREMLSNPDRLDSLLIDSATTKSGDKLRILAADEALDETLTTTPAGLLALLAEVGASSDDIVIDMPRRLDAVSRKVFDLADVVAIVTDRSLSGMRDTQRLLKLVQGSAAKSKCVVVANRVGGVAGEIAVADFERGIEAKIAVSISSDAKAALLSAQLGKPFAEVAKAPKTIAELQTFVQALVGAETSVQTTSLLSRILRK